MYFYEWKAKQLSVGLERFTPEEIQLLETSETPLGKSIRESKKAFDVGVLADRKRCAKAICDDCRLGRRLNPIWNDVHSRVDFFHDDDSGDNISGCDAEAIHRLSVEMTVKAEWPKPKE